MFLLLHVRMSIGCTAIRCEIEAARERLDLALDGRVANLEVARPLVDRPWEEFTRTPCQILSGVIFFFRQL
jgi:hypothetical protein